VTRCLALVTLIVALGPLVASDQPFPPLGAVSVSDRNPTDPAAGSVDGDPQPVLVDLDRCVHVQIVLTGSLEADFSQERAHADRAAAARARHVSEELLPGRNSSPPTSAISTVAERDAFHRYRADGGASLRR